MLEGEGPGHPVAGLADAVDRQPRGVDVVAFQQEVDDRREHLLPVVPEGDVPLEEHRLLPRAVEQQHVVAALETAFRALAPAAAERAVAAVVHHEGGPRRPRGVGAEEPPRHALALVGDVDALDGPAGGGDEALPRRAVGVEGRQQAFRAVGSGDRVDRDGQVVGRAQVAAGRADPGAAPRARAPRHGAQARKATT